MGSAASFNTNDSPPVAANNSYKISTPRDAYVPWRGWREKITGVGETWLRAAAATGSVFAMERIAECVVKENATLSHEALIWLNEAAQHGSVSSWYTLGSLLIDEGGPEGAKAGCSMLNKAAEVGFIPAATELGIRLVLGLGVAADTHVGQHWLRIGARSGDRLAMILMAHWVTAGILIPPKPSDAAYWLVEAGAVKQADLPKLGSYLYSRARSALARSVCSALMNESASLFLEGYNQKDTGASVSLAFIVRRHEVEESAYPPLEELLRIGLSERRPVAMANEALRRAAGVQCSADWVLSDHLIQELDGSSGVLEWWSDRVPSSDPEHHLILGWLVRHGLTADPDGLEPSQRFAMLEGTTWKCPDWLN